MTTIFPNSMKKVQEPLSGKRVDIIMRTKDRLILLVRAFCSILDQTHKDWHLYLINDGGDKEALERTLAPYKKAFGNKITVVHNKKSLGMEGASNVAYKLAKGDFLIVHDDDDSWHPTFLEKTVSFLRKSKNQHYAGVITNCQVIQEEICNGGVKEMARYDWGFFKEHVSYMELLTSNMAPPITFLIRRDAALKIGPFNENLPVLGDWDYILRVMQVGDIGIIKEKLAYYHHRINSTEDLNYQNTVLHGVERHLLYNNLYKNAFIRDSIDKDPANVGLFIFLAELQRNINALHYKFDELQRKLQPNTPKTILKKIEKEFGRFKKRYLKG